VSQPIVIELIHAAPAALWVLFALFAYLTLRPVIKSRIARLASVKTHGVEINFENTANLLQEATAELEEEKQQITDAVDQSSEEATPTAGERRGGVARLEHAAAYLVDRTILWVDDHPNRNRALKQIFANAGIKVDSVRSTSSALTKVRSRTYDLIITDMYRASEGGELEAAYVLMEKLAERRIRIPVILYSDFKREAGIPAGIFAYTSSSDNLVQYVIDVMERIWFGIGMRVPTTVGGARRDSDRRQFPALL
jgi:CheY-like chemotaxis protein